MDKAKPTDVPGVYSCDSLCVSSRSKRPQKTALTIWVEWQGITWEQKSSSLTPTIENILSLNINPPDVKMCHLIMPINCLHKVQGWGFKALDF